MQNKKKNLKVKKIKKHSKKSKNP